MNGCTVGRLIGGACEGVVIEAAVFNGEQITACGAHSDLVGPLIDELDE